VPAQVSAHPGVRAPEVARVGVSMLRRLREAIDGAATAAEVQELRADLDNLIGVAERSAWPL
jgi:hypothetical protein